MTESIKETVKWNKHEIEEKIGHDQCKFKTKIVIAY